MIAIILGWLAIGAIFAGFTYLKGPWSEVRGIKTKLLIFLGPIGPIMWWIMK